MKTITIGEIARIASGINCKIISNGKVYFHQMRDYNTETKTFAKKDMTDLNKNVVSHLLQRKDLLITAKGAKFYCAVYNCSGKKAVASNAFFVVRILDKRITPEYLSWFLNQPEISQTLIQWKTNYFILNKDAIASLSIPLLDRTTQDNILTLYKEQKDAVKMQEKIFKESQSNILALIRNES